MTNDLLRTGRDDIVLRPYDSGMLDEVVTAANHPEVARYMADRFPFPYTVDDGEQWIDHASSQDPTRSYAVVWNGEFIGGVGYETFEAELNGTVEMGWWLTPSAWHQGIMAVAARALMDDLFENRGAMRIEAPVMHANPNSGRVAEKIGMTFEGVAPSRYVKHGVRYDQLNHGITKAQWESTR